MLGYAVGGSDGIGVGTGVGRGDGTEVDSTVGWSIESNKGRSMIEKTKALEYFILI